MSYSCERLFQGVNAYPCRTFRYIDISRQGWYDLIKMTLKSVTLMTEWLTDHGLLIPELLLQLKMYKKDLIVIVKNKQVCLGGKSEAIWSTVTLVIYLLN